MNSSIHLFHPTPLRIEVLISHFQMVKFKEYVGSFFKSRKNRANAFNTELNCRLCEVIPSGGLQRLLSLVVTSAGRNGFQEMEVGAKCYVSECYSRFLPFLML